MEENKNRIDGILAVLSVPASNRTNDRLRAHNRGNSEGTTLPALFNVRHALLGLALLALGVMLYMLFRPAGSAWLLPACFSFSVHPPLFLRALIGVLPALLHTAGFSLLTCAVLGGGQRANAAICLSWASINILFELGQLPLIARWIEGQFEPGHATFITAYFLRGTFDFVDMVASGLGAMLAWNILYPRWRT